jgi:hypothetical protein
MSSAPSDRNLLFGVLALQLDFIDRDALIAALHAWVLDKNRTLGEILVAQQILNPDERDVLDALVQKHLDRHRGDIDKSLAAVPVATPLREELFAVAHQVRRAIRGKLDGHGHAEAEPEELVLIEAKSPAGNSSFPPWIS